MPRHEDHPRQPCALRQAGRRATTRCDAPARLKPTSENMLAGHVDPYEGHPAPRCANTRCCLVNVPRQVSVPLPGSWPIRRRNWPLWVESGPTLAEVGPILVVSAPILVDSSKADPRWANDGQKLDELGPMLVDPVTSFASVSRCRPSIGRTRPTFGRFRGRLWPSLAPTTSRRGRNGPSSTDVGPTSAPFRPGFRVWGDLGKLRPSFPGKLRNSCSRRLLEQGRKGTESTRRDAQHTSFAHRGLRQHASCATRGSPRPRNLVIFRNANPKMATPLPHKASSPGVGSRCRRGTSLQVGPKCRRPRPQGTPAREADRPTAPPRNSPSRSRARKARMWTNTGATGTIFCGIVRPRVRPAGPVMRKTALEPRASDPPDCPSTELRAEGRCKRMAVEHARTTLQERWAIR